jgi:hypothetical protein
VKKRNIIVTMALLAIAFANISLVTAAAPLEYLYEDAERGLPFAIPTDRLQGVETPEHARQVFRQALESLSERDKGDPMVLDALALLGEECIRRVGTDDSKAVRLDILDSALRYGVALQRELRLGVTLRSENLTAFTYKQDAGVSGDMDLIYMDTPFAVLRFDMKRAISPQGVSIKRLGAPWASAWPAVISTALRFWSLWTALAIMLVSLLVESLRKNKMTRWMVLSLCLVLFFVNGLSVALWRNTPGAVEEEGVEVKIPEGMTAVLSIPLSNDADSDLTVVKVNGEPLPCKYNPVTHTMDARIKSRGKYTLKISAVYFNDVKHKSAKMQHAIRILTSCGLMDGAEERGFLPDREITRAEFLSVVLRVMDLFDESAESDFPDVLKSDWFYSVAASAQKERLISGYEDGAFRGNTAIPKEQMVTIAASALVRMMSYHSPEDVDAILRSYTDGESIPSWAKNGVALAALAGIIPERADGRFDGAGVMTRGDAAVMLYRLFSRIW